MQVACRTKQTHTWPHLTFTYTRKDVSAGKAGRVHLKDKKRDTWPAVCLTKHSLTRGLNLHLVVAPRDKQHRPPSSQEKTDAHDDDRDQTPGHSNHSLAVKQLPHRGVPNFIKLYKSAFTPGWLHGASGYYWPRLPSTPFATRPTKKAAAVSIGVRRFSHREGFYEIPQQEACSRR
ncbi:unnamed protein product [Ectocarpus fasciculatus]